MPKSIKKFSPNNKLNWLIGFGDRMSKKLIKTATPPELKLKIILDNLKFEYNFQKPIIVRDKYLYIMDFYFPKLNLCIELQSIKWHTTKEQIKKDSIKKRRIKSEGIQMLYIWAKQVDSFDIQNLNQLLSSYKNS